MSSVMSNVEETNVRIEKRSENIQRVFVNGSEVHCVSYTIDKSLSDPTRITLELFADVTIVQLEK